MAYGRLDVFWPDGHFETFTLGLASVSVGRSSGNTIMLDTDTISRYHFSITREAGQVFLTDLDSANGTFIDGLRIDNSTPVQLRGGEEILIGHLRMHYHTLDDAPTVPTAPVGEETQRIEKETMNFRVDLQLSHLNVAPGSYMSVELLITNISSETLLFTVETQGLPQGWVRINRPALELDAGEDALVLLNVKPKRQSDATPGNYPVDVIVSIKDKPDVKVSASMVVTILPFSGFGIALSSPRVAHNTPLMLHMHNQGSSLLGINVKAISKDATLRFKIVPNHVTIEPGKRHQVRITPILERRRWFGETLAHPVDIVTTSSELPHFTLAVPATVSEQPPIPQWLFLTVSGIFSGLLLLLAFVIISVISAPPPEPVIESLVVNGGVSEIAQGTPITIRWSTTDTDAASIRVGDQLIALDNSELASGQRDVDSTTLQGELEISLQASNGTQSVSQSRLVTIYQPPAIDALNVSPEPIWSNIVQTIVIDWTVSNASEVTLIGLDNLVDELPEAVDNRLEFVAIPEANFTLTLLAQDDRGNSVQASKDIILQIPTCQPAQNNVVLYAEANLDASVLNTIRQDSTLQASGIDQNRLWLRFTLGPDLYAWGERSDFICDERFSVENLRTIVVETQATVVPPLITLTPTAPIRQVTPTATPSQTPIPPATASATVPVTATVTANSQ